VSEQPVSKPAPPANVTRSPRFRAGALAAVAVVVGLILWLSLRDTGGSSSQGPSNATAVSPDQLKSLASSVGHPVFWLGPKPGETYELTRTSNGSIYVRYLPPGVDVGSKQAYLTVATYPFPAAYPAIQNVTREKGVQTVHLPHRGLAEIAQQDKTSVHAAYPGIDYQVEVFDPTPGNAWAFVKGGQLTAVGNLKPSSSNPAQPGTTPTAFTLADLKALPATVGHTVYWAGPKRADTYEVTQTTSGQVYVRYLPRGAQVGTKDPYLSVATYPFSGALAAIQAVSKKPNQATIKVPGGGLAVYDRKHPKSIHLAFPGSDFQIEVFDPSPVKARRLVAAGRIAAIG